MTTIHHGSELDVRNFFQMMRLYPKNWLMCGVFMVPFSWLFSGPVGAKAEQPNASAIFRRNFAEMGMSLVLPKGFVGEELDLGTPGWRYHVYNSEIPVFDLTILPADGDGKPASMLAQAAEQLNGQLAAAGFGKIKSRSVLRRLGIKKRRGIQLSPILDPASGQRFSVYLTVLQNETNTLSVTIVEPEKVTKAQRLHIQSLLQSLRLIKRKSSQGLFSSPAQADKHQQ